MARAGLELVHDMAVRLPRWIKRKADCYNGRHRMQLEKSWHTITYVFYQEKCFHCEVRKVKRIPLGD